MNIEQGYQEWITQPKRKSSGEVDFGAWWAPTGKRREFPRWRVSWIENTGELYATDSSRYILLGTFQTRAEVEQVMEGWAEPDSPIYHNLTALSQRIG